MFSNENTKKQFVKFRFAFSCFENSFEKEENENIFRGFLFHFFENHYVAVLVFNRRFMLNNVANSKNINYSNKIELIKIQNKKSIKQFLKPNLQQQKMCKIMLIL